MFLLVKLAFAFAVVDILNMLIFECTKLGLNLQHKGDKTEYPMHVQYLLSYVYIRLFIYQMCIIEACHFT